MDVNVNKLHEKNQISCHAQAGGVGLGVIFLLPLGYPQTLNWTNFLSSDFVHAAVHLLAPRGRSPSLL